ncbi:GNVR domain-containing protein [Paracoccus sp. (in: a-proteobacteria)]|uniref:GNVR domain-containing protein n=1 Tax=Paracoccus sp. TaxID=267 RepID=UPI00396C8C40
MSRDLRPYEPVTSYEMTPPPPVQTIELRRMLNALRRQRMTILLPAAVMTVLGLTWGLSKPATYSASATLLLNDTRNNAVRQIGGLGGALPEDTIENARVVLGSNKLAFDVLDTTSLDEAPGFLYPPKSGFATAVSSVLDVVFFPVVWLQDKISVLVSPAQPTAVAPDASSTASEKLDETVDPARRRAAFLLQRSLEVARVGRSTAISVNYTSHDPAYAAAVVNAYADSYTSDILSSNAQSVGQTNTWMVSRLQELRAQAQAAADAAEQFAAENQLAISSTGELLGEQAQSELNASLTTAIGDRARAQALLDIYDRAVAGGVEGLRAGNPLTVGGDVSDTLRARLDTYNDVTARLQQLLATSGPDHPQVAGLRQTLSASAERLFIELQSRRQDAAVELSVAEERVEALRRSLNEATASNAGQAAALIRLRSLQQEAETLSALYQSTLTKSQEIEQQQSFPVSNVRVLSYAETPTQPSGPAIFRSAIAAGLLGLFIGLARAALREGRENFLRTANDVTGYSGLRFLGHLPVLGRGRTPRAVAAPKVTRTSSPPFTGETLPALARIETPAIPIPVLQHPDSVYAETLRHVRLAASGRTANTPVTGVTSFHPYPGRASVALNLAGQMAAASSQRVLLIDADRRGRQLSRLVGLADKPGLTDVAAGKEKWQSVLFDVKNSNLTVLACGQAANATSDDLTIARTVQRILNEVGNQFGNVVLDVPPLYPVAQGLAILRELPGFIIVGEWGKTPRDMVDTVLMNHPHLEANCLGVVYDRVNLRRLQSFLLPGSSEKMLTASKSYSN